MTDEGRGRVMYRRRRSSKSIKPSDRYSCSIDTRDSWIIFNWTAVALNGWQLCDATCNLSMWVSERVRSG